ncbi:hypothetical protein CHS0354_006472 [Potamilus streckersoni]|uniref:Lipase maturation factor n=1 Tax=Potamilus streckersoni TaxID=2493646 RepID=A0AAE0T9X4_9BIVA|nr:hypothetical protein CHS0354_006472 [Potamilus streckersoni]
MANVGGGSHIGGDGLRKRGGREASDKNKSHTEKDDREIDSMRSYEMSGPMKLEKGTYWLTRIVILRYLGFIYCVAFLVALNQNRSLLGINGLLPAHKYLNKIGTSYGGINLETFMAAPTLLWLFDYEKYLDNLLDCIAYGGLALSGFLIINGGANWIVMLTLWVLYHSLVNVGQRWYSFGWESQLLETGFLATFLCPILTMSAVPRGTPTSSIVIYGFRWFIFRIMLGAGLIKIRGDQCWRDLTCMNYHYETQPVPNPMSYYMHQSPEVFHKFETLSNHFIELIAPFMLFMPRPFRMIGGGLQILFQVVLIISGNLSFLNWLTILPSLACFDDASIAWMFSGQQGSVFHKVWKIQHDEKDGKSPDLNVGNYIRRVFNISLGVLIAYLSIPVVQNLLSSRQAMNTSFDPFRLVNTYGAFGSVTKERTEVIFQGTDSLSPYDNKAKWEEYEFKCKPGRITRWPCLISPYHYRLDWLMWFAAFQSYQHNPWLFHLGVKLLANDGNITSLIEHNPFEGRDPPRFIRAEHYRYRFTKIGSNDASEGHWWKRTHIGNYMPPISLETAADVMRKLDYDIPKKTRRKRKSI